MSAHHPLRFTEEMKGSFGFTQSDDGTGSEPGAKHPFMFHLTISVADVERFKEDPTHEASAAGWIHSDVLGGRLEVERGVFNLFVTEGPRARRMLYPLEFNDGVGHPVTMTGFKEINGGSIRRVWPETTTLYIKLLAGTVETADDSAAQIIGDGVLRIHPLDFARQLTTFRVTSGRVTDRLETFATFGDLFAGQLFEVFLPRR